ncbi:MAG TPA: N-acetylmuramoyl-L-alanine amidase [Streptosporangiaceae bacterium]|jgi:N-acetylmuramoyl-L-alanine amidase|nr:N-acetylmuramoyl-L-alanine amidase [Streptosporangiaceae bacterium]
MLPRFRQGVSRGAGVIMLIALPAAFSAAGCSTASRTPSASPAGSAAPGSSARRAAPATPSASAKPGVPATPAARARPAAAQHPLAGKVIVLDPGHNGANWSHPATINRLVNIITGWKACDTTGTQTNAGYAEHAFNFNVATRLARLLRAEGAKVILTRHNDNGVGPCITKRAAIGNRAHADAAISIHADGGPPSGTGFEVITPGLVPGHNDAIIGPSHRLALDIRGAYQKITHEPFSDYVGTRGLDTRTDLGGLNLSTVPKVFIECGNMRNPADAARLSDPGFRQRAAKALAAGFTAFLTRHGN